MDQELKQFLEGMESRTSIRLDKMESRADAKFEAMDAKLEAMDAKIDALELHLKSYVDARVERAETNLLSAFHGWARSMEIRVRGVAGVATGFDERLALAEERISELERKKAS